MRKLQLFRLLAVCGFVLTGLFSYAQSSCSPEAASGLVEIQKGNSGCTPSACRGAKTKFGEAKVISNLRLQLIDLKAKMEKSSMVTFSPRSYDIKNIIGETDEESLTIIIEEVKLIENEFHSKLGTSLRKFNLPDRKARQVRYLEQRMTHLSSEI